MLGTCHVDPSLMEKAQPLAKLDPSKPMPEAELIKQYLRDTGQYNELALTHNTLVDHIEKYCLTTND